MTDEQFETLVSMLTINLARIYDALIVALPEDDAAALVEAHSDGNLLGPKIAINEETFERWNS